MELEEQDLLQRIAVCIEFGKDCRDTSYPEHLQGEDGVDELVRSALGAGIDPNRVLVDGMMPGMDRIGALFGERKAYVPQLLLSARAMTKGLEHLKPFFESGEAIHKGKLVLGVVLGDLHDIGKNLVRMMVQGAGWEVIDIGIDQPTESFLRAIEHHPECSVGVGTLLTSTMNQMRTTVEAIKRLNSDLVVVIGGAPVSEKYSDTIGADRFLPNAQAAREFFASL